MRPCHIKEARLTDGGGALHSHVAIQFLRFMTCMGWVAHYGYGLRYDYATATLRYGTPADYGGDYG